ncbi:MAG: hypothetical protein GY939_09090, partial [Actinomycetia bacterium]|nr:hypothetical protein [Actinomycetes bacterium]
MATVNIAKADDAIDIIVTGNTVLFTEDAGATTSLFTASIDTIETGDTISQVILTLANVESGDTLSFGATDIDLNTNGATVAGGFTYTVSSAGVSPVVTITHAGTDDATVNTMLNSAVFNNTANNDPGTTARTVTLTSVTDSGSGTTADGTVATVNVAKADDAIDITVTGNTVLFTEDAGATTSLFGSTIDTIETGDTISQVILTLANVEAGDTLSFGATNIDLNTNGATVAGGFTYTVSSAGATPVVTITHAGTDDGTVNTMLNSLVFNNTTNNDPSTTARTVTLTSVTDSGSGTTANGTVATVNVAKADDAIDITVTGNTVLFTEDAGATTSLFSSAVDTIETGDTISQVILTLANVEAGDTLSFGATDIDLNTNGATVAGGFTYTVTSAGATPVVTITHAGADDATVNTMLNSLVFNNTTNNDPSTAARTVTLTSVTDSGSGTTADGTVATVNVAKADDAIDITVNGNTVLFTEDVGATTSLFSSTIDTIETGDTITQLILTMANVESGDTLTFGATNVDLNTNGATVAGGFTYTVSSAGATPVVTITHAGTDDGTVNTMLNSLVFNNTTNNDPGTTARTVTLTSVTDSGSGTTADGTVA